MARPTILVVDGEDTRRKELVRGLTGLGYEVIAAAGAEEGRRFADGLAPGLVIADAALVDPGDPLGLRARASQVSPPSPRVVLFGAREGGELPDGVVGVSGGLGGASLLLRVRTALLADELRLPADPGLESLAGDLERLPLFELLPMLQRAVLTGHLELEGGFLQLEEGEVVAAAAAGTRGVKAFTRLARNVRGSFRIVLEMAGGEREIFKDLLSLMAVAIEDQHLYEEARGQLPALSSRMRLEMGPVFFATQFSPTQQRLLEAAQGCRTPWHLLDRVASPDGEALAGLAQLHGLGIVALEDPEVEVRVVTDSAGGLPPPVAQRLRVATLPLTVMAGQRVLLDGTGTTTEELLRLLATRAGRRHRVRVEPVSREEAVAAYRGLVARSDVVSLHVSERLSQTVTNARAGAERGRDEFRGLRRDGSPDVEVVDTTQVSAGQALLVVAAARMAGRQLRAHDIRTRVEAMRDRVHTLFIADAPQLLEERGLLGKVGSWLAGHLGIKPILGVVQGRVAPVDQVRTGRTALPRAVELLAQRVEPARPVMACVAHAAAPLSAVELRHLLQERFNLSEIVESEIGAIGLDLLGTGCVAVALLQPNAEEVPLVAPLGPDP